jgi:hypothetical protein
VVAFSFLEISLVSEASEVRSLSHLPEIIHFASSLSFIREVELVLSEVKEDSPKFSVFCQRESICMISF